MKNTFWRIFLGVGLLLIGVVSFLQVMNVIELQGEWWGYFFSGLFLLGGLVFLSVLVSDRKQWWAAIPGFTLLGLGALIGVSQINDALAEFGAVFLFLGISLAFWVIFFLHREHWWAVIPGGVMLSLAALIGVSSFNENNGIVFFNGGGVFLLGLALTFVLVALLPAKEHNTRWAWIPAGVLGIVSLVAGFGGTEFGKFVWPAALILAGGILVVRSVIKKG